MKGWRNESSFSSHERPVSFHHLKENVCIFGWTTVHSVFLSTKRRGRSVLGNLMKRIKSPEKKKEGRNPCLEYHIHCISFDWDIVMLCFLRCSQEKTSHESRVCLEGTLISFDFKRTTSSEFEMWSTFFLLLRAFNWFGHRRPVKKRWHEVHKFLSSLSCSLFGSSKKQWPVPVVHQTFCSLKGHFSWSFLTWEMSDHFCEVDLLSLSHTHDDWSSWSHDLDIR